LLLKAARNLIRLKSLPHEDWRIGRCHLGENEEGKRKKERRDNAKEK
jgi:hypothetical protein